MGARRMSGQKTKGRTIEESTDVFLKDKRVLGITDGVLGKCASIARAKPFTPSRPPHANCWQTSAQPAKVSTQQAAIHKPMSGNVFVASSAMALRPGGQGEFRRRPRYRRKSRLRCHCRTRNTNASPAPCSIASPPRPHPRDERRLLSPQAKPPQTSLTTPPHWLAGTPLDASISVPSTGAGQANLR